MKTNNKKLMWIIFIVFATVPLFCQNMKEKIKNIEGTAETVTIKTSGGTYEFSGEDAQKILKRIKSPRTRSITVHTPDFDDFEFNIPDPPPVPHVFPFGNKDVDVKVEGGEITVSIKTGEDGNETTKVLKGKEAEEFLENEVKGPDFRMLGNLDSLHFDMRKFRKECKEMKKHLKKIIIEKETEEEE